MKIEYTREQLDAAVKMYQREMDKLQELRNEAEELLEEGEMLYRKRVLGKIQLQKAKLEGMDRIARTLGIHPDELNAAANQKGDEVYE